MPLQKHEPYSFSKNVVSVEPFINDITNEILKLLRKENHGLREYTIATKLNCKIGLIRRHLRHLEKNGFIESTHKRNQKQSNDTYIIKQPCESS